MCDDIECFNGGKCIVDENTPGDFQLKCDCPHGFVGIVCERNICGEIECNNSGNCTVDESDPEHLKPKCDCPHGFGGVSCDRNLCSEIECLNAGNCTIDTSDPDRRWAKDVQIFSGPERNRDFAWTRLFFYSFVQTESRLKTRFETVFSLNKIYLIFQNCLN